MDSIRLTNEDDAIVLMGKHLIDNCIAVTLEELKRIIRLGYCNDDKFGQAYGFDSDEDPEDTYWIFIEDVASEDEFEMIDDYPHFVLVVSTERGTTMEVQKI